MNENVPTHLDLFSGIGGFALAARWAGFRTVGFCEIDSYCQSVLAKNFLANAASRARKFQQSEGKDLRDKPAINGAPWIIADIRTLDGTQCRGVSLLTGGFPCQPFSVAGKQRGAKDDRHLWPEMLRVIDEARPAWVLGENVPGIIPMELDNVLSDLETISYACWPFIIPACAVDAKHRRDRVWIVGHDTNANCGNGGTKSREQQSELASVADRVCEGSVSNPDGQGLEGQREVACRTGTQFNDAGDHCRWEPEPSVGRVANGVPNRVDRLRGLGNAIVPQVAYEILKAIHGMI